MSKISKKDKKIYITFGIIIIASLIIGFMAGFSGAHFSETIDEINWPVIAANMYIPMILLFLILGSVCEGTAGYLLYGAKKVVENLDSIDDDDFDNVIKKTNITFTRVGVLVQLGFVAGILSLTAATGLEKMAEKGNILLPIAGNFISVVGMFVIILAFSVINAKSVKYLKIVDPNKKGNVFDINFRKEWYKSMDEAELVSTAFANQRGFIAGIYACLVLWVLTFISMLIFDTGMLAVFSVSVVLVTMIVAQGITNKK